MIVPTKKTFRSLSKNIEGKITTQHHKTAPGDLEIIMIWITVSFMSRATRINGIQEIAGFSLINTQARAVTLKIVRMITVKTDITTSVTTDQMKQAIEAEITIWEAQQVIPLITEEHLQGKATIREKNLSFRGAVTILDQVLIIALLSLPLGDLLHEALMWVTEVAIALEGLTKDIHE